MAHIGGCIGIVEKKMETTIMGLGSSMFVWGSSTFVLGERSVLGLGCTGRVTFLQRYLRRGMLFYDEAGTCCP